MRCFRWIVAAALLVLPSVVSAQTDTGRLTGTVRDGVGLFISGAKVTATNEQTGEFRSALTNTDGIFLITPLKPATYTIKVEYTSFAPLEYTQMRIAVGQELAVDFELKPATLNETISVVGTAPIVDISSARLGANVSEVEVATLPINGRQMSQLMLQAPGSINTGAGTWQDVRFSGRAVEQNVIRYDGIEASAVIDSAPGNLNGEIATPFRLQTSLENVQEFRVDSSNYPAEYGMGTGGQISVITKSGGNQFHGSVFEYFRSDKLDAPNYFDTFAGLPKSKLKQNQFGGSIGGPILKNKAFFFASYEGYVLDAGVNWIEAVPSDAAWARAAPAVLPLRAGFLGPGAVILPGKSSNPDFDIAQLQGLQQVREHAVSARIDYRVSDSWSAYGRISHDQGKSDSPEGVTGRVVHMTDNPTNAVFNLQGILNAGLINETKFGYNAAPTTIVGQAPVVGGVDWNYMSVNFNQSSANNGIPGQGSSTGQAVPGGLVRANSATNGHAQPYDPYSLTLSNTLSKVTGNHFIKFGGELRAIRMETDRIGGTTYAYSNLNSFLNNTTSGITYLGDVSEPSVFNNGATGPRNTKQEFYAVYGQDEWRASEKVTLNLGLRWDYYAPLREVNDLVVIWRPETGVIEPNDQQLLKSQKTNFQPRLSATFAPVERTVLRGGFGVFVGPGQVEDQIQPVESDRISTTLSNGTPYPVDTNVLRANFENNPNTRAYGPRAYSVDYEIPERIYQYTASVQQQLANNFVATAAYVGSQGRNLFLRSVANNIVDLWVSNPTTGAATPIREYSIVLRDAAGNITGVQNPYTEVDYKTSGGHDSYNSLQLQLTRRTVGLLLNAQYTLSSSKGTSAGSNDARRAANNARTLEDWEYDNGYNLFDVRHGFNASAVYEVPYGAGRKYGSTSSVTRAILGNWDVGGILNARSGIPVEGVYITRPDIVYVDGSGNVYNNAAAGRTAVINTPRGGSIQSVRRPDLIPGVDPFVKDGGVVYLNPAAFAIPKPGEFGNLERNSLHGPSFRQFDLLLSKQITTAQQGPAIDLRVEVFNLFNTTNFANPAGVLPNALPANATTEANTLQPGQPYSAAAGGTFGKITQTVNRTVGLGTNRQVQLAFRIRF